MSSSFILTTEVVNKAKRRIKRALKAKGKKFETQKSTHRLTWNKIEEKFSKTGKLLRKAGLDRKHGSYRFKSRGVCTLNFSVNTFGAVRFEKRISDFQVKELKEKKEVKDEPETAQG